MKRRMNNIFRKDGRSFVLAMDHSAMMPSPDIKEPGRVISEAEEGGADGFLTTYGIIRKYQKDFGNKGGWVVDHCYLKENGDESDV